MSRSRLSWPRELADLPYADAGPDPLRGAIISSGQLTAIASVLAESLGIVVDGR